MRNRNAIVLTALTVMVGAVSSTLQAQNFGEFFQRKHITLVRKLPPTGRIDGTTFSVNVTGAGSDVTSDIEAQITSLLVANDGRLQSVTDPKERPDALIKARVTAYQPMQIIVKTEQGLEFGKKGGPVQNQQVQEITGLLSISFEAQDLRAKHGIAADTITTKFDREYPVNAPVAKPSMTSIFTSHLPKTPLAGGSGAENRPPTAQELRTQLIKDASLQIASRLVNTTEEVNVFLARGGGLDDADKLMEQKLYTRALESLETMPPYPQPDQEAYRLYNLGVVNEALGYDSDDVAKARKYLQQASIDYGKAIDAKPTEKMFLEPQNRIDTALAHYKVLGDELAKQTVASKAAATAAATAQQNALTNTDVISMVQAKLDQGNIIDTIQHSEAANFDLSVKGQIALSKAGVNGQIITAMKQRARSQ
ncbi:MAG TPA: hypothetical protein VG714_01330 [Acidobacteriaceae bacterium]|nr:hypothetical protein [Acidobacteriaceae bacterium]